MHKIWLVIKREYLIRVKTKGFVITTLMVPLSGVLTVVLIAFIASHGSDHNLRLAIVDNAGGMAESTARGLKAALANGKPLFTLSESIDRPVSPDAVQQDLRTRINSGSLDAYLVIPADLDKPFELHTKNPGNFTVLGPLSAAVNRSLIEARLRAHGIKVDDVGELARGANLQVIKVSQAGESVERGQTLGVGVGLVILLYMSLLIYGITTMRSVLEEKTSRTMEMLISSVRPVQLLTGKILGVAGAAFTQFMVWIVSLGLLLSYGAVMASMFSPGSSFPKIHVPVSLLVWAGCFFMGGYFLYSAMFAAIGSACSSEEDAQQLQWPWVLWFSP
jgi:ABC-2 type transport system permease protein